MTVPSGVQCIRVVMDGTQTVTSDLLVAADGSSSAELDHMLAPLPRRRCFGSRAGAALSLLSLLPTLLCSASCGDEGGGDSGGGSGTGAVSGGTGAGGSNSGGSNVGSSGGGSSSGGSSAGSAGSSGGTGSGSDGATSGTHCSPGDVLTWPEEVYEMFGGPLATCVDYEPSSGGVTHSPVLLVTNIDLPQPMASGSPYAFSIVIGAAPDDGSVTIEFWGSDAKCGFGAEKLYTGPMTKGTLCVEFEPSASYEHVLMVWRGEGSLGHNDVAICPAGACE